MYPFEGNILKRELKRKNIDTSQLFVDKRIPTVTKTRVIAQNQQIVRVDKEKNIISGTFWFDAVNEQGKKVEIREGRFDMVFEGWAG